jgi:hypothetical protein
MKLHVNVDIPVPSWLKHSLVVGVVPALILATVTIVRAGVPNTFADGETLGAQTLNDNFDALDTRLSKLEDAPQAAPFEGFSVSAVAFVKPAGWAPIVESDVEFNTFGASSFDVMTGTFWAPKDGYYRFSAGGFSPTSSSVPDSRVSFAFIKNHTFQAVSGGQLSTTDSPLPAFSYVMQLAKGDQVRVDSYSQGAITLGGLNNQKFWFQGQFLGH